MAATAWLQLSLELEDLQPGQAQAQCEALGALSVTLSDAGDQPVLEPLPGETPTWPQTRLAALFSAGPDDPDESQLRDALAQALQVAKKRIRIERLAERDWSNEWRKDLAPRRFGERLWICPDGQRPAASDALVIDLDPGLAFGTGSHPTTALCLEWLAGLDLSGQTVIDYGCGSGVLALAAARLGATRVWATDIDPQALEASARNAQHNGLQKVIRVVTTDDLPGCETDILVANILANPLRQLAGEFATRVRVAGRLALAGLLQEQVDGVLRSYQEYFALSQCAQRENWALLAGRRLSAGDS